MLGVRVRFKNIFSIIECYRPYSTRIDWSVTASDYARHRQGFPEEFFQKLQGHLNLGSDQTVLDLGTGTGTIARGLAVMGCDVTAIDTSERMMEEAKKIDKVVGVSVKYHVATAEATQCSSGAFDIVVAGQSWHWFKPSEAIAEVVRVSKKDAKLVIAHFDWLPFRGSIPLLSESLIQKYNPHWTMGGGTGFYPKWTVQLAEAQFRDIITYTFDLEVPYTHAAWRGRIRASAGISASLSEEVVIAFDKEHDRCLKEEFPQEPLLIPHRCFTLIAKTPFWQRINVTEASKDHTVQVNTQKLSLS